MKNKNKQRKQRKPLHIVIALLSFALLFNIAIFFSLLTDEVLSYRPSEESIMYKLKEGDLVWVRRDLSFYHPEEIQENANLREIDAISTYFESSFYYYAYAKSDPDIAALYKTKMEQSMQDAGEFSFYLKEIDPLFEPYAK